MKIIIEFLKLGNICLFSKKAIRYSTPKMEAKL